MRQAISVSLFLRALLILLLSLPVIALLLALETRPQVDSRPPLAQDELAQIEHLLLDATPQSPAAAGEHVLTLEVGELNLLVDYGLELLGLSPGWTGTVSLDSNALRGQFSVEILGHHFPVYLNVDALVEVTDSRLRLTALTLGNLPIPGTLLEFTRARLESNLMAADSDFADVQAVLAHINEVAITPELMVVDLHWEPVLVDRIGQQAQLLLISADDRERITRYYEEIALLAATIPADLGAVSLNTFLAPLFQSALSRSQAGGDPIAENRTLLQALAIYVNNEDIARLVGSDRAAQLPSAKFVEVRLHRRQDLAQHLVSIAAISASAGAGFAQLLSNTKEAYDARYRSGFSFSDLAANTVGVTLASYATRDETTARLLQARMAAVEDESDYMPEIGNNRDGISESDFNALYEDRNSPEYQARLAEIEELIATRPLFRDMSAVGK